MSGNNNRQIDDPDHLWPDLDGLLQQFGQGLIGAVRNAARVIAAEDANPAAAPAGGNAASAAVGGGGGNATRRPAASAPANVPAAGPQPPQAVQPLPEPHTYPNEADAQRGEKFRLANKNNFKCNAKDCNRIHVNAIRCSAVDKNGTRCKNAFHAHESCFGFNKPEYRIEVTKDSKWRWSCDKNKRAKQDHDFTTDKDKQQGKAQSTAEKVKRKQKDTSTHERGPPAQANKHHSKLVRKEDSAPVSKHQDEDEKYQDAPTDDATLLSDPPESIPGDADPNDLCQAPKCAMRRMALRGEAHEVYGRVRCNGRKLLAYCTNVAHRKCTTPLPGRREWDCTRELLHHVWDLPETVEEDKAARLENEKLRQSAPKELEATAKNDMVKRAKEEEKKAKEQERKAKVQERKVKEQESKVKEQERKATEQESLELEQLVAAQFSRPSKLHANKPNTSTQNKSKTSARVAPPKQDKKSTNTAQKLKHAKKRKQDVDEDETEPESPPAKRLKHAAAEDDEAMEDVSPVKGNRHDDGPTEITRYDGEHGVPKEDTLINPGSYRFSSLDLDHSTPRGGHIEEGSDVEEQEDLGSDEEQQDLSDGEEQQDLSDGEEEQGFSDDEHEVIPISSGESGDESEEEDEGATGSYVADEEGEEAEEEELDGDDQGSEQVARDDVDDEEVEDDGIDAPETGP